MNGLKGIGNKSAMLAKLHGDLSRNRPVRPGYPVNAPATAGLPGQVRPATDR